MIWPPPTNRVVDFTIGRVVLFRHAGECKFGRIAGEGTELRLPLVRVRRTPPPHEWVQLGRGRHYWRNRSQLFEIPPQLEGV